MQSIDHQLVLKVPVVPKLKFEFNINQQGRSARLDTSPLKISGILLMRGSAMGLLGLGEVDLDPDGGDAICEERRSTVLPAAVARA